MQLELERCSCGLRSEKINGALAKVLLGCSLGNRAGHALVCCLRLSLGLSLFTPEVET